MTSRKILYIQALAVRFNTAPHNHPFSLLTPNYVHALAYGYRHLNMACNTDDTARRKKKERRKDCPGPNSRQHFYRYGRFRSTLSLRFVFRFCATTLDSSKAPCLTCAVAGPANPIRGLPSPLPYVKARHLIFSRGVRR